MITIGNRQNIILNIFLFWIILIVKSTRNRKKLCIILIVNIYSCEFYFVICTIEMNNLMKEILLYILYTNSYAVVKIDQFFIMYSDL